MGETAHVKFTCQCSVCPDDPQGGRGCCLPRVCVSRRRPSLHSRYPYRAVWLHRFGLSAVHEKIVRRHGLLQERLAYSVVAGLGPMPKANTRFSDGTARSFEDTVECVWMC